jgi:hypothetical protein
MSYLTLRRAFGAGESLNSYNGLSYIRSSSRSFSSQCLLPTRSVRRSTPRRIDGNISSRCLSQFTPSRQAQAARPSPTAKPSSPSASTSSPPPSTARAVATNQPTPNASTTDSIYKSGLSDKPLELDIGSDGNKTDRVDWTRSFHGISAEPFPKEAADILQAPTDPTEVEIKPDGIIYLPEIKYRRILNKAFGPGGWGLVPRSESIVTPKTVTREYALICNGR